MRGRNGWNMVELLASQHQVPNATRSVFGKLRFRARCIGCIMGLGVILLLVTACERELEIFEEIRSIKTITVGETAIGRVRKFSGIVRAVDRSALSFEVGGNVQLVNVDIGARVEKGQILAALDEEPYRLEVEKAESELEKAKAKVKNERANYRREKGIFDQGAGSKKRLDQAEFAFRWAMAGLDFGSSKLNLAKRDLRKTVLYAPYDGTIGARYVEPFVEVRRGQAIFEIDADGDKEVNVGIPETTVNLVTTDTSTLVSFPTLPGKVTAGKVTQVGTLAGKGNAFPVDVKLLDPPSEVRSGMTAEVTFELKDESLPTGHLVPGQALIPTMESNKGHVFVYQADTSTVKKTPVRVRGVKDNWIVVSGGISQGNIVAVAGVSFLSDGMEVKLMPKAIKIKSETLDIE